MRRFRYSERGPAINRRGDSAYDPREHATAPTELEQHGPSKPPLSPPQLTAELVWRDMVFDWVWFEKTYPAEVAAMDAAAEAAFRRWVKSRSVARASKRASATRRAK